MLALSFMLLMSHPRHNAIRVSNLHLSGTRMTIDKFGCSILAVSNISSFVFLMVRKTTLADEHVVD